MSINEQLRRRKRRRYGAAALLFIPTAVVFLAWVYVSIDGLFFRYGRQPTPFGPRAAQPDPKFIALAKSYGVSYENGPSQGWLVLSVVMFILFILLTWNFFGAQKDGRRLSSEEEEANRQKRIRERMDE
jgi:hypothetical protein